MIGKFNPLLHFFLCQTVLTCAGCQAQTTKIAPSSLSQGALLSVACTNCHSPSLQGLPNLSEQSQTQIQNSLMFYKSDVSGSSVMHRLSRGFTDEEIRLISAYYAQKND